MPEETAVAGTPTGKTKAAAEKQEKPVAPAINNFQFEVATQSGAIVLSDDPKAVGTWVHHPHTSDGCHRNAEVHLASECGIVQAPVPKAEAAATG